MFAFCIAPCNVREIIAMEKQSGEFYKLKSPYSIKKTFWFYAKILKKDTNGWKIIMTFVSGEWL